MAPPESLASWLAERTDDELSLLLELRPDLGVPPPQDSRVLATRAGLRASVARAADELDAFRLAVLEAAVVAGDGGPVDLAEILELLGPGADVASLRGAVDSLRARVLLWGPTGEDETLAVVAAARDVVPRASARFGRSSPQLADVDVPALLATVPEPGRRLLHALATGSPVGRTRDAATGTPPDRPVQQLLRAGLLLRVDESTVELPAQVGAALRAEPDVSEPRLTPTPPAPPATRVRVSEMDDAAGGEALELLRHAEAVLEALGVAPAPALRAGGLGTRELRRVAKAAEVTEDRAAFLVEVLHAAGLVATGEPADSLDSAWTPTTAVDTWSAAEPAARWTVLARSWLEMARLAGPHGLRDSKDKPIAALSEELRHSQAPRERRRVLGVLADRSAGSALDAAQVGEVLAWLAPRWGGRDREQRVGWVLTEAAAFGLLGRGALSTPGRALLASPPPANRVTSGRGEAPDAAVTAAMAAALPAPVDHVLVQADLTVVAPGPLQPELAREIELVADVESAGAATVYRVGPGSVRRALDAGRGAAELHALFERASRTPVPQALTYLVDDVARRHGRLRAGVASSFVRCDDEALLAEVLVSSVSAQLGLRRLAPTVAVSGAPLAEVLAALRDAGFAPAGEDAAGAVLDLRPERARVTVRAPRRRSPTATPTTAEQRLAVVAGVRAGDAAARALTSDRLVSDGTRASGLATLEVLGRATREGRTVFVGYVDDKGVATQRVVEPVSVGSGVFAGHDTASGALLRYSLHRITSVALAG